MGVSGCELTAGGNCPGRADEGVCRVRGGEPVALLGLIENRNMLKFSFVLGWGLGNMPFGGHFYDIISLSLTFGSVLCPQVLQKILF